MLDAAASKNPDWIGASINLVKNPVNNATGAFALPGAGGTGTSSQMGPAQELLNDSVTDAYDRASRLTRISELPSSGEHDLDISKQTTKGRTGRHALTPTLGM